MPYSDHQGVATSEPLLAVRGLTKVYGRTAALAGVDFSVGPGEIHALLGENGAGKSTLVRVLAAIERADGGSITFAGTLLPLDRTPQSMSDSGVVFIHQDLGLVPSMTVAENVAQYASYALGPTGINWKATRARARDALATLEVDLNPGALVAELSIAEQAAVAITRALALDARLIVLDEPTASLAAGEASRLLAVLHRLRDAGVSCILVTHRLEEVLRHCDRVTVLRDGSLVGTRHVRDLTRAELIAMIVGELPPEAARARRARKDRKPRLDVAGFRGQGFGPVDLQVAPGEIVGVTGLADAGHLNLVDAMFGAQPSDGGSIRLDGVEYRPSNPARALERGIHQVPSDRLAAGLAGTLTARENLFPNPPQHALRPLGRQRERRQTERLMDAFDIRPRNSETQVSTFSGGNAQKLLIARALSARPRLLLLSEPTSGVDVGARTEVYAKLRKACAEGLSIVMASSEFEEVTEVADRAVVLCRGRVVTVLEGDKISVAALTGASYGT